MPVVNWEETTIDGKTYLVIDAKLRVPKDFDPSSNVFVAVAAPTGGLLNYPALVKGDQGDSDTIDSSINFTALAYDDPTVPYASFTEITPGVQQLNLGVRNGAPGANGSAVLHPSDFTSPLPYQQITLNSDASAFVLTSQRVGNAYYPTTVNNTPSGNAAYTLCAVGIPAQTFPWRPRVSGQCLITGTGSSVTVDLIARLNGETAGNIVGRAIDSGELSATTHIHPTHRLSDGAPWSGYTDTYDRVNAGDTATIYLRAERTGGTDTFTTSNSNTFFKVKVEPIAP